MATNKIIDRRAGNIETERAMGPEWSVPNGKRTDLARPLARGRGWGSFPAADSIDAAEDG